MIIEEKLNNMYDSLINNNELTTKELENCGFNSKDITDLLEEGLIKIEKIGTYSIPRVEKLYNYGKKLILLNDYDKANACFKKCIQIDENHLKSYFQLFFSAIQLENYSEVFKYFEKICDTKNLYYKNDNNFYLYLLSIITEVPDQYKEYVKNLKFEDIRVDFKDARYKEKSLYEQIRTAAFNQKLSYASKLLKKLIKKDEMVSFPNLIVKTLLEKAEKEQIKYKNYIVDLITFKEYERLKTYLENIQEQHNLSKEDAIALNLTNEIINIKKTGKIPEKQAIYTNQVFEAINNKDFSLALSICKNNIEKQKASNDSIVFMLLKDINELIESIKEKQNMSTSNDEVTIEEITASLSKQDLDNSFELIKKYLEPIGGLEYKFLVFNLIKISLIEKDLSFTKPIAVLITIKNGTFNFDSSIYLDKFYKTLNEYKLDEARIYLNILSQNGIWFIDELEQLLAAAKQRKFLEDMGLVYHNLVDERIFKGNNYLKVANDELLDKNKDLELINSKMDQLYNNGIVLLEPMNRERRKKIYRLLEDIPDVVAFSINEEPFEQLVLRHAPKHNKFIPFFETIKEANDAYNNREYDRCIELYRKLIKVGVPKVVTYAKLGLAYMKSYQKDLAIDYLTVADGLAKKEGISYDFSDLIDYLKGTIDPENKKTKVKMSVEEFNYDVDEYYGISNLDDIVSLINSGISIDDACTKLNVDDENKSILYLIFAKECYYNELYSKGDEYLKQALKNKNRSKELNKIIEEVRKNKRFYKNRIKEDYKPLILKIN